MLSKRGLNDSKIVVQTLTAATRPGGSKEKRLAQFDFSALKCVFGFVL